jgi:hypothetical protein
MSSYGIFTEKFHLTPDLACLYMSVSWRSNSTVVWSKTKWPRREQVLHMLTDVALMDFRTNRCHPAKKRTNICQCVKSARPFNALLSSCREHEDEVRRKDMSSRNGPAGYKLLALMCATVRKYSQGLQRFLRVLHRLTTSQWTCTISVYVLFFTVLFHFYFLCSSIDCWFLLMVYCPAILFIQLTNLILLKTEMIKIMQVVGLLRGSSLISLLIQCAQHSCLLYL